MRTFIKHALKMSGVDLRPGMFLSGLILLIIVVPFQPAYSQEAFDHNHLPFTEVLNKYVAKGLVNYRALKADQAGLDTYLHKLANIDPVSFKKWTREQQLTMWINAYNAFTIKAILNHYPIEHSWVLDPLGHYPDNSIRQIRVWDNIQWTVMGNDYTLDHMEHVIMRRELAEPRVHYALVCASIGCPYLENRAYEAPELDSRLDQAGTAYIYDSSRVRIDKERKIVSLPQIYKWFKEDFEPGTQYKSLISNQSPELAGILSWVYKYANDEDRKFLANETYKISYLFYDWALNEMR
jgi:hypothetical protein